MARSSRGKTSLNDQNEKAFSMKKSLFKLLAQLNKLVLPRYSKKDINRLSKIDKALVAYRYWVTIHALD